MILDILSSSASIRNLERLAVTKLTKTGIENIKNLSIFAIHFDPFALINDKDLEVIELNSIYEVFAKWPLLTNTTNVAFPIKSK